MGGALGGGVGGAVGVALGAAEGGAGGGSAWHGRNRCWTRWPKGVERSTSSHVTGEGSNATVRYGIILVVTTGQNQVLGTSRTSPVRTAPTAARTSKARSTSSTSASSQRFLRQLAEKLEAKALCNPHRWPVECYSVSLSREA